MSQPLHTAPPLPLGGAMPFNVQAYHRTLCDKPVLPYNRRDYFKIWTVNGEALLHYANRSIHINRPALIFSTPLIPYSLEYLSKESKGYMCIFTQEFLKRNQQGESLLQSPLFGVGENPVFFPDEAKC